MVSFHNFFLECNLYIKTIQTPRVTLDTTENLSKYY